MAYDQELEERIDTVIGDWPQAFTKKKMFGGLSYFVDDKMCFAIRSGGALLLRVDVRHADALLEVPGIEIAAMGQRQMKNWLEASGPAIATDAELLRLLEIGREFALTTNE